MYINVMEKNLIKVQVRLFIQPRPRHEVHIVNLSLKDLHLVDDKYVLALERENNRQWLSVGIEIDKKIIENRMDVKRDIAHIIFKEETFDLLIDRYIHIQSIKKENNKYSIKYKSNQFQIKVEIYNQLNPDYYDKNIRPKIENTLDRKRKKRKQYKSLKKTANDLTEDLLRKDFLDSELYRTVYSPNSDADRSFRERFGGNLGNYSRSRRR